MYLRDYIEIFVIVVCVLGIVGILSAGIVSVVKPAQCEARSEAMGLESQWGWRTGCMIKIGAGWRPLSAYRLNE